MRAARLSAGTLAWHDARIRVMGLERPASMERAPLAPTDPPRPELGPGELLMRLSACAVCRTDLQICEGELPPHCSPLVPRRELHAPRRTGVPGACRADPDPDRDRGVPAGCLERGACAGEVGRSHRHGRARDGVDHVLTTVGRTARDGRGRMAQRDGSAIGTRRAVRSHAHSAVKSAVASFSPRRGVRRRTRPWREGDMLARYRNLVTPLALIAVAILAYMENPWFSRSQAPRSGPSQRSHSGSWRSWCWP